VATATYKLRGVPRTFKSEAQALAFLRNSPGYMKRQETYLRRFWPGLYMKAKPMGAGPERSYLQARSNRLRGKKSRNIFDALAEGAESVAQSAVEGVMGQAYGAGKPSKGPKVPGGAAAQGALAGASTVAKGAIDAIVGPETRKLIGGEDVSLPWLGVEAAGLLPLGKPLRGLRAAKAARYADDAARVADDVDPVIAQARKGLKEAPALRGKQEALRRTERAKRSARLDEAIHIEDPVERQAAMNTALKGKYPALNYDGFAELNDEAFTYIDGLIRNSDELQPFETKRALDALVEARAGKVPTRSDQELLERVIGKTDITNQKHLSAMGILSDVWNLPRSVMSAFDLSAPFRQGLVAGARHPRIFARNFKPMIRSFMKQGHWDDVMNDIATRENFARYKKANLALTDLGSDLLKREEHMISRMAGKLPGVKHSNRGYTAFLNKMRADVFDTLIKAAPADKIDDPEFLQSLAAYINASTGRGNLGKLEHWGPLLNSTLFSPRLLASRFNMLNPAWYMKQDPWVRKQALRAAFQTTAAIGSVLGLATLAGAKVSQDRTNADFAKIKVGDSRFDIGAGFFPVIRLVEQIRQGKITSSTTGKEILLNDGEYGSLSTKDIIERFFRTKMAPSPSLVWDKLEGQNVVGQEFEWDDALYSRFIPLLLQDSIELGRHEGGLEGVAKAAGAYGIGMWGVGFQTYSDAKPKSRVSTRGGKPSSRQGRGSVSNKPSRQRSNKP